MFHRLAALGLVLAFCAMTPKNAAGQSQQVPRGPSAKGRLGVNYPNPFNPDTYLPFSVGPAGCAPGSGQYDVSMQLINVLGQIVAEPVLYGPGTTSSTTLSATLKGRPIKHVTLACGDYVGYWDGKTPRGREAASGVLGQILTIDGESQETRRIFYKK
jgi:hypothetical protein